MKKILLLLTLTLVIFTGCSNDDDDRVAMESNLKQGWLLTSETINGQETDLSTVTIPELLYFTEKSLCYTAVPVFVNGQWVYSDTRTAWSYDHSKGILNIADMLPTTVYIDELTGARLAVHYYKYNDYGDLDHYEKTYAPAKVKVEGLKVRVID